MPLVDPVTMAILWERFIEVLFFVLFLGGWNDSG